MDDLLNEDPAVLLRKSDPKLVTFAQFLLRYVILGQPKELLINDLENFQKIAYQEDPSKEKQDKFECALDHFSSVLVAMIWMQYDNHHQEWYDRKMSNVVATASESSKCTSKFTSDNKGRKAGGCYVHSDGLKLYNDIQVFIENLKADINYEVFQKICNAQAREYKIIKDIKVEEESSDSDDETASTDIQQNDSINGDSPTVPIFRMSGGRGLIQAKAAV